MSAKIKALPAAVALTTGSTVKARAVNPAVDALRAAAALQAAPADVARAARAARARAFVLQDTLAVTPTEQKVLAAVRALAEPTSGKVARQLGMSPQQAVNYLRTLEAKNQLHRTTATFPAVWQLGPAPAPLGATAQPAAASVAPAAKRPAAKRPAAKRSAGATQPDGKTVKQVKQKAPRTQA